LSVFGDVARFVHGVVRAQAAAHTPGIDIPLERPTFLRLTHAGIAIWAGSSQSGRARCA
jgi:hypothetical protein